VARFQGPQVTGGAAIPEVLGGVTSYT
jgi:hypothetical protein